MNTIIIIITVIVVLSLLILLFHHKFSLKGSSCRAAREFKFDCKFGSFNCLTDEAINLTTKTDKYHLPFINNVCDYINNTKIEESNKKFIIVGDTHVSILQTFMPLRQAGILKHIHFDTINRKFEIEYEFKEDCPTIIYCGDFNGRSTYAVTNEIYLTLFKLIRASKGKIIWVLGNHDIMMLCWINKSDDYKYLIKPENRFSYGVGLFPIEFKEVLTGPNFKQMKKEFNEIIKTLPYPCIYYNKEYNFTVSHTVIKLSTLLSFDKNFENYDTEKQINLINNLARTVFDKTDEDEVRKILFTLYATRPESNVMYYAPNKESSVFIGHDAVYFVKYYLSVLYDSFKRNYPQINEDEMRYEFSKHIYNKEFDLSNIIRYNNSDKNLNKIYCLDVWANAGIGYDVDYKNEITPNLIFKNYRLYEYGYNLSLFATIDKNKKICSSKIYLI